MAANCHTHTWRCTHARGAEREYVENALRGGPRILGLWEHAPMLWYVSHVRIRLDRLDSYVGMVPRLKQGYKNDIQIHPGFEVEYDPAYNGGDRNDAAGV